MMSQLRGSENKKSEVLGLRVIGESATVSMVDEKE